MTDLLSVRDVISGYGGTEILRGVSVTVGPSSCIGLLGPNGAGKSTLLRVISGQLPAWSGELRFMGRDATRWGAARISKAGLRWVGDPRPIFPTLSVQENLEVGGAAARHATSELQDHVFSLLPDLATHRRQRAGTLSGGQQQMLAIGQALMTSPRLLCLDEPSLGLSPYMVAKLGDLIRQLAQSGLGILWAEQFPDVAAECCSELVFLRVGQIVGQVDPAAFDRKTAEEAYFGPSAADNS